ncbi:MAG: YgaP family membrane protein [Propionibacteriaceae bacterium]
MTPNMSLNDRKVRSFIIAPLLVILAIVFNSTTWLMVVLLVLAVVMWATSAIKTCPLYMPFKFSTIKK